MSAHRIRSLLCVPLGIAAMSVYAHALGGVDALNFNQCILAFYLVCAPSLLCLIREVKK